MYLGVKSGIGPERSNASRIRPASRKVKRPHMVIHPCGKLEAKKGNNILDSPGRTWWK